MVDVNDFETPYSPLEMSRQMRGLKGDKNMTQIAIKSTQDDMAVMLKGEMGEDMKAVLNGERKVDIEKSKVVKFKLLTWFKNVLRKF